MGGGNPLGGVTGLIGGAVGGTGGDIIGSIGGGGGGGGFGGIPIPGGDNDPLAPLASGKKGGGAIEQTPEQRAILLQQMRLAEIASNQQVELFRQQSGDAQQVRDEIPGLQSQLLGISNETGALADEFRNIGNARRGVEENILGGQLGTADEVAGRSRFLASQAARGGNQLSSIANEFLNTGGVPTQGTGNRLPPGFNVGAPLNPAQAGGAFTRGGNIPNQGTPPLATTQPVQGFIDSPPNDQGVFTRGTTGVGFDGATTQGEPVLTPPPRATTPAPNFPEQPLIGSPSGGAPFRPNPIGPAFVGGPLPPRQPTLRPGNTGVPGGSPLPTATTNPVQAPINSRSPVGNGLPGGFDGATTQPQLPPVPTDPLVPSGNPALSPPESQGGLAGIQQQGQDLGGLANTVQTELGTLRGNALGTLNQVSQGQVPEAVQGLFTDAGGARERDILELQFQNARNQAFQQAGAQGGGLDRNLALLSQGRALGIAGQEERRTDAQRQLAQNLFGVATQAGLGAPGEVAGLRGQSASVLSGAEGQRQSSLQGSLSALDTALGRELQGQQASIAGLSQSQQLAQQLAGQIGQNADQFLFAQPGLFGQEAGLLQNIAGAPGLPTSLLQGLPINNPAGLLGPAQQTLSQQQIAAQQAQAAENAGFGQLLGTAGIAALALFT